MLPGRPLLMIPALAYQVAPLLMLLLSEGHSPNPSPSAALRYDSVSSNPPLHTSCRDFSCPYSSGCRRVVALRIAPSHYGSGTAVTIVQLNQLYAGAFSKACCGMSRLCMCPPQSTSHPPSLQLVQVLESREYDLF